MTVRPPPAFSPPGIGIEEAARRLGHYIWLERRLFEVLGSWVADLDHPAAVLLAQAHAHHHAWHAQLWLERLPRLPDLEPDRLVLPAQAELTGWFDDLAGAGGTDRRLAGMYRVLLPRLVGGYTLHLDSTSRVSDGPIIRALELILADDHREWHEGEVVLQSVLSTPAQAADVARRQADLEGRLMVAGGLIAGIGPGAGAGGGPPQGAGGRQRGRAGGGGGPGAAGG